MSSNNIQQVDADRIINDSESLLGRPEINLKYNNCTRWPMIIRGRNGIPFRLESTSQMRNAGMSVNDNNRFAGTLRIVERHSFTHSSFMYNYNTLKNKENRTLYEEAMYKELHRQYGPGTVTPSQPYAISNLNVTYIYHIEDLMRDTSQDNKACIYLREHDIVIEINTLASDPVPLHPCDLNTHGEISRELLGDSFKDDDTTIVAMKLVDNSGEGRISHRYFNLGKDALRLDPVQDNKLINGLNVAIVSKKLNGRLPIKVYPLDSADVHMPLYRSKESAAARDEEREYYRRENERRKLVSDMVTHSHRMESEILKARVAIVANVQKQQKEDLQAIEKQRIDAINRHHQLESMRKQRSQLRLRETGDTFRTVIAMATGLIGFFTYVFKVK